MKRRGRRYGDNRGELRGAGVIVQESLRLLLLLLLRRRHGRILSVLWHEGLKKRLQLSNLLLIQRRVQ